MTSADSPGTEHCVASAIWAMKVLRGWDESPGLVPSDVDMFTRMKALGEAVVETDAEVLGRIAQDKQDMDI